MPDTQPQLGYGKPTEASIDQVNQWMRSTPWYQGLLKSWGQDPNNVHLNDSQKQQIIRQAQANGVVVDQGHMEVDPSGNFNPVGHKLRNTLIVAGLAAATIGTMGAAGVFAGAGGAAAGAGGGAAGAAGAGAGAGAAGAGTLASTTIGSGFIPAIAGGTGLAGTAGAAGAAGAGGLLASSTLPTATGTIAGGTGLAGAGSTVAGGGGMLGAAGKLLSGGKGLSGYLDTAGSIGGALGAAGKGLADSRQTEALFQQRQDALDQQRYGNDLTGARLNLSAPSERAHTSVQGDILANAKPFTWTGGTHQVGNIPVPEYSGGLSPDVFSTNTRALGAQMSANALKDNSRLPLGAAIGSAPGLTPLPQAGTADSILNTAGTIGNFADILRRYRSGGQ